MAAVQWTTRQTLTAINTNDSQRSTHSSTLTRVRPTDGRPLKQLAPSLALQRIPGIAFLQGVDAETISRITLRPACNCTSPAVTYDKGLVTSRLDSSLW